MTVQQQNWIRRLVIAPETRRFARTLTGCVLSYGAARLATLPEGYWALITTLIVVTQPSLTQAITTARDQVIGACIGAIVGGIGIVVIERGADPVAVVSIALLPLAALAAARPGLRLACVTLVIVVLVPGGGGSAFERPLHRVAEIMIGAAAAFIATVMWPNRAVKLAHRNARECLEALAQMIQLRLAATSDDAALARLEQRSIDAQSALAEALQEAGREHVFVPILRGSSDAIDKVQPFLVRLHRDVLVFGQALLHERMGDGSARVDEAWPALPRVLTLLADAVGAVPVSQRKLRDARASLAPLLERINGHAGGNRPAFAPGVELVMSLIVKDMDGLVQVLMPSGKGGSM
ncbi:FUSC family protein [Paraburkholderia sp. CNPSo 3157]|uniref:FUSC family protein n=1 Tax=Paraburkholderia franconis TaxID=2654983 RepID=A0A7X1NC90_9BURK|nr:FUSC family protein [Paraburkholderia franconis]MPW19310.1 FUSC family protein [Paraburkholderia franconis]